MELEGSSKGPQRLVLRCADDEGNLMCFICREYYAPSAKTLYDHLKSTSCCYKWRSVLPNNLFDISTVSIKLEEEEEEEEEGELGECNSLRSGGDSTTTRFLGEWNGIGKKRSKRSAPAVPHDHNNRTKEEGGINVKNRSVVAEATVGKVVRDFDLNELPSDMMMGELPDHQ